MGFGVNMMFKKNKLALFFVITFVAILFTFQNCSSQKWDNNGHDYTVTDPANILTTQATDLQWRYTSGTLPPSYQYEVIYKVNFANKQLVVSVTSGAAATGLPIAKTMSLSDLQIFQIRTYFDRIAYAACPSSTGPIGGGISEVSVFTGSTSAHTLIYLNDCGYGVAASNKFLSSSGFQNLTNYLSTL